MGYMLAMGCCFGCGRLFGFNPERVPSVKIDGINQPVCLDCVNRVNPKRIARGLPAIVPLPGAYDEEECS